MHDDMLREYTQLCLGLAVHSALSEQCFWLSFGYEINQFKFGICKVQSGAILASDSSSKAHSEL